MRRGHQRHMLGVGERNVGGELTAPDDETTILAHAPIGRHELKLPRARHQRASLGRLSPRRRSAASAIASTIWAYPVQRQILPEIASTMSSRVGSGLFASSACAVRIIAGVQ